MRRRALLAALAAFLLHPGRLRAQCDPVGARIGVAGDDTTLVWVNGTYVGFKDYCNMGTGCRPDSLYLAVPPALLSSPRLCLALQTANKNPVMVFSSWELEVDCAGGRSLVVNSAAPSGISLDWDPTGGGSCGRGTPPPPDGAGRPWTDPDYDPASNPFTLAGAAVTANTWTAGQVKNALTGLVLPFISYSAGGDGSGPGKGCGVLYWRQVAAFPSRVPTTATPTPVFTPVPALYPFAAPTFIPSPLPTFKHSFPSAPPTRWEAPPPLPVLAPAPAPAPRRRSGALPAAPRRAWPRPTPTLAFLPVPSPAPPQDGNSEKSTPPAARIPRLDRSQGVVFHRPPVEIYVTFADGPGRYQLEVVDGRGRPLRMIFDRRIVAEKDAWASWDGKDGQGRVLPPGRYYAVFYRDGRPLRSIPIIRVGGDARP